MEDEIIGILEEETLLFTYLPFCQGIDRYQTFGLAVISSTKHDDCFNIMYVNHNTTTQSCKHSCHFLDFLFGEVIATNLYSLMKLPVHMHILHNSSKNPTNTNRNIIFISEANLFKSLKLLEG